MKNELEDAPMWGLRDAERVVLERLARDNKLLAQLRKEMRRRERQAARLSRAQSGDKISTQA